MSVTGFQCRESVQIQVTILRVESGHIDEVDANCMIYVNRIFRGYSVNKQHLSISLAKMICPNIFSTSSTSNRRSLFSGMGCKRCDGCKSQSRIAHKTEPGGNRSAMCIFASKVFRIARYYIDKY